MKLEYKYSSSVALLLLGGLILVLSWFAQEKTFERLHINDVEYLGAPDADQVISRNTGPVCVKEIKESAELYSLDISFEFATQEPTFSYGNLFQTGDSIDAIRMELQPSSSLVLILGDGKIFPLSSSIQLGTYHSVHLKYERNHFFKIFVNGTEVLNIINKELFAGKFDISNIVVGTGMAKQRILIGSVRHFNLDGEYSYTSIITKISRWILALLGILISIRLYFFLQKVNGVAGMASISIVLIIIFCITLLTCYFFPIYPDEIQVRFWLSRLPYDFPEKISGSPACLTTFFQPISVSMYLPSLIDWVVHGRLESHTALRQVGFFIAFLWVGGVTYYLNKKVKNSLLQEKLPFRCDFQTLYIAGLIISIFGVGIFPIFLITNRSEQLILPSVVLLMSIFLVSNDLNIKDPLWKKMGLIILYFVAVSLILYSHAKGLFLLPFFVVIAWSLCQHFNSRLPFIFAMALLALHVEQSYFAFKYAFQCHESPQYEEMLKNFSLNPTLLFYDPLSFFDQAYHSLIRFPKYLIQLGFQETTDANYLFTQPLATPAKLANILIQFNVVAVCFALMFFLPLQYYRKDTVAGRFVSANLVLLVLSMCVLINAIFNIPKNWYDAGYFYAILLIILIFFIGENFPGIFQKPSARKVFVYLAITTLLSQAVFIDRNLKSFVYGYAGPGVSIAKDDSNKIHDELAAASRTCNIDPVHSKKIVVDDYTYLYFQKSKWPLGFTYISLTSNDNKTIQQFFSKIDSDGLVVRCTLIPSLWMPVVKKEGNVCCIPKSDLKKLIFLP